MKITVSKIVVLFATLTFGAISSTGQLSGSLDTSFGSGGVASIYGVSANNDNGVVQADGKIIKLMGAAGGSSSGTGYLIRWNADGTPDTSFDGDGVLAVIWPAAGGGYGGMRCIALQGPAGAEKILVAGYTKIFATGKKIVNALRVDRYNPDGSPDQSFGTNGSYINAVTHASDMAVQSDGRIVTVGGDTPNYAAVRLTPNGGLDTTFGNGGAVNLSSLLYPWAVAVQADGKIVAAGSTSVSRRDVLSAVRLNANGSVDTSFGSSGRALADFGGDISRAFDIAIRTDSTTSATTAIVLGGLHSVDRYTNSNFAVARLTASGQLDVGFSGGKLTYDFAGGSDSCYGIAFQSDGKLVAAGYAKLANNDFGMLRYNIDGTLDPYFGLNGRVTTDVFGASEYTGDVMIQNYGTVDERIVLVGVAVTGGGHYTLAARYFE